MKLLQITPEAPGYVSGGTMGVLQTLLSLDPDHNQVDYIGPKVDDENAREKYHKLYELKKNRNPVLSILYLLKGITNQSYKTWTELKIKYDDYDAIVLDFAKQDYVLSRVPHNKLIVRCHNVEYDFAHRAIEFDHSFRARIVSSLSEKQEGRVLAATEVVVPITANDSKRLHELYDLSNKKEQTVPVCVDDHIDEIDLDNREDNTLIITGSLWYGANFEGIKWFLENVFPSIKSDAKLVIAGRRPNQELKDIAAKAKNVRIIDSPEKMQSYFEQASLAIAPVFDGAGMKVKVAEALSYGLPVVGTKHAFIGYEAVENQKDSYICDKAEEFIDSINSYLAMSHQEKIEMQQNARCCYLNHYSIASSVNLWKGILQEVSNGK